jgi:hypothetical protein
LECRATTQRGAHPGNQSCPELSLRDARKHKRYVMFLTPRSTFHNLAVLRRRSGPGPQKRIPNQPRFVSQSRPTTMLHVYGSVFESSTWRLHHVGAGPRARPNSFFPTSLGMHFYLPLPKGGRRYFTAYPRCPVDLTFAPYPRPPCKARLPMRTRVIADDGQTKVG